ncbi:MAG: hypothetical protein OXC93_12755 [Rhodospirillaceae bacterium]|nr:hypothetical protein [Rhodospirillaceae bacterium]
MLRELSVKDAFRDPLVKNFAALLAVIQPHIDAYRAVELPSGLLHSFDAIS